MVLNFLFNLYILMICFKDVLLIKMVDKLFLRIFGYVERVFISVFLFIENKEF